MHDRAVQDLEPARARRFSDDDLGDVVGVGKADHVVGDMPAGRGNRDRFAAEALGEPQRVGDAVALLLGELQAASRLDTERRERRMQPVRQPLGIAHEASRARVLADADQDALARCPGARNGAGLHLSEQLLVDPLGGAAQRELAQRRQVGGREKMLERALGLSRNVNLAFLEPLDQVVGREIDQLDGVGAVEDGIRHGLAHAHMGDLGDDVVQAFDVLDVDGRIDVDAAAHQLFDVEIALGMAAAGRVGVGEFVHEDDLRPAGDDGIEVHLLEPLPLVFKAPAGDGFEPREQGLGLSAAVRLDDADDDVVAVLLAGPRRLQHLVGLADAGRRAHENPELADAAFFAARRLEQSLRRGSLITIASLIGHQ